MEEKKEKTRLIFRREDMFGPHQTVIFHLAPVLPLLLPSLFHQPKKKRKKRVSRHRNHDTVKNVKICRQTQEGKRQGKSFGKTFYLIRDR